MSAVLDRRPDFAFALSHITVFDLSTSPAAGFAAMMFAANGAAVFRPVSDGVGGETSDFLSVATTPLSPEDLEQRIAQTSESVVIMVDAGSPWCESPPSHVVVGVADQFGACGPYSRWSGTELIFAAMGGAAMYTEADDGQPVYGAGNRYRHLAGLYLFISMVSLLQKPGTQGGRVVRVSELETVTSVLPYATTQFSYNGEETLFGQSGPRFSLECIDGWVSVYMGTGWGAVAELIEVAHLSQDERFVDLGSRITHAAELGDLARRWSSRTRVADAVRRGKELNVPVTGHRLPAEVVEDPELESLQFWRAGVGQDRFAGMPWIVRNDGTEES